MNKNKLRVRRCGFLMMLLLVSCAPAVAQHMGDSLGGSFNNPAGATITKTIMDRIAQRNRERRLAARRSGASSTARRPSASAPPVAKLNESSVLFRPTGTQLKTREIANLIDAGNPQVLKLLTVLLEEFDKGARAAGHPNDLALALSFFLATNASVYHDGGQPADPPMVELRDTIAEALVQGNALNGVTDRKKQEMYETLVIFTGFALATYQEGKQGGNADTVKVSRQLAGQNLLALIGISPDKITFTDQGLSIDNGSNTADASASVADSSAAPTPTIQNNDPFPDRPGYAPQKPLSGPLNATITMADLVGTWDHGAGSVQTYIDSYTGDYSHTNTTFYGEQYSIKSDGTFEYKFVGRSNNTTVRESDSGSVILSGSFITIKFKGRTTQKYQFIAFMTQPNGAAILSLVGVHDTFQGYDAAGMSLECGHSQGYIHCVGGEEWARLSAKPVK
jgi:hypothetical protein